LKTKWGKAQQLSTAHGSNDEPEKSKSEEQTTLGEIEEERNGP
jgi:hypothetical protein